MPETYESSKRITPVSVLAIIVSYAVISTALAIPYIMGVWFIPIVYINFLLPIAWALITCKIAGMSIRATHARHPAVVGLVAFLGSLVGYYVSWSVWLCLIQNSGELVSFGSGRRAMGFTKTSLDLELVQYYALNPQESLAFIKAVNENGLWTIFGKEINGLVLTVVWILEFLIFAVYVITSSSEIARLPYYEEGHSWFKKEKLNNNHVFCPIEQEQFDAVIKGIENGDLSYLATANLVDKRVSEYFTVEIFTAPNAPYAYATIKLDVTEGKKKKERTLIEYMKLDMNVAGNLTQRFA